jgi:hypothetical protein
MKNTSLKLVIWYSVLLISIAVCLSSCSIFHKIKKVERVKTDSTAVTKEQEKIVNDSDSFAIRKEEAEGELVIEFSDTGIYVNDTSATYGDEGIYVYPKGGYLEITKEGIKTNKPVKKVTLKGKMLSVDSAGKVEHITYEKLRTDSVVLKKEVKAVEKTKESRRTPFFSIIGIIVIAGGAIWLALWIRRKAKKMAGPFVPPI